MSISYFFLIPAVLLLWLPRGLLRRGTFLQSRKRFSSPRSHRQPGEKGFRVVEEFSKPRNYIDLLRGIAGSYGVMLFSFTLSDPSGLIGPQSLFAIQVAILIIGVFIQTIRWDNRRVTNPPAFYLVGISAGLCGYQSALFGAATAWAFCALVPHPAIFLVMQALSIGGFCLLFEGLHRVDIVTVGIGILPVFLSFALRRSLAIGTVKHRH